MNGFSHRAIGVIDSFVANLQLPQSEAAVDGSYSFAIDNVGFLSLTPSEDGERIIISLKRLADRQPSTDELLGFLKRAQFDPVIRRPVTAGMASDGGLVLAASFDDGTLDLPTIEGCIDRLGELHNRK